MTQAMLVDFRLLSRPVSPFSWSPPLRARHRRGHLGPYRHRTSRLLQPGEIFSLASATCLTGDVFGSRCCDCGD